MRVPRDVNCEGSLEPHTTPLQALNLMNDPTYVEASRFLASACCARAEANQVAHPAWLSLALCLEPRSANSDAGERVRRMESSFTRTVSGAEKPLTVGEAKAEPGFLIQWNRRYSTVARTVLNSTETSPNSSDEIRNWHLTPANQNIYAIQSLLLCAKNAFLLVCAGEPKTVQGYGAPEGVSPEQATRSFLLFTNMAVRGLTFHQGHLC